MGLKKTIQLIHATISTCLFMEGNVGSPKKKKKNEINHKYDLYPPPLEMR